MKYSDLFNVKRSYVNRKFKDIQELNDYHDVFLLKDLLDMRDGLMVSNFNQNEINDIVYFVCCED